MNAKRIDPWYSSPVRHDIGTPGRSDQMEDEVGIEDGPTRASDLRCSTPEGNPAMKRDVEDEDDTVGEDHTHPRVTANDAIDSIDTMNEDERQILNAAIFGVDITEVYSPVRVAAVAGKFGLSPGMFFRLHEWLGLQLGRTSDKRFEIVQRAGPLLHHRLAPCTMFSLLQELTKSVKKGDPAW